MRQEATTLPADVPLCHRGHTPQLVHTFGAPIQHRVGEPCPDMWHIECARCGMATVPSPSRALAELRWTDDISVHRIPLSQIGQARARVLAAFPHAA